MRIRKESDLEKEEIRKKIIEAIESTENKNRKEEAYKAYQCYKDNTKEFVYEQLRALFEDTTVQRMQYAITNVAFIRKIIDKLARVYKYGVDREVVGDEKATQAISKAVDESDVNSCFKKTNRILKLSKNCLQYIIPKKNNFQDDEVYEIKCVVLPPYLYDVVEQYDDRTKPGCIILSDYNPGSERMNISTNPGLRIRSLDRDGNAEISFTDGIDSAIADVKDSKDYTEGNKKRYVFWSDNYHFITDEKGVIIPKSEDTTDIGNPIGKMPFVNYAEDQDNSFWAQGGTDLVDGAISLNTMLTNINHIAITQAYGQLVITGSNLPQVVLTGPDRSILLEYDKDEQPTPTVDFKSANPPIQELLGLIETYVALLLTTNNLSTSGVRTQLNGVSGFASGIAKMIDSAESLEDIEDQRQIFIDNEPRFWEIYSLWHKEFKDRLVPELQKVDFPDNFLDRFSIKYEQPKVIQSDKERLEVLKQKIELNLISRLDALKTEYPDMTDDELKLKLEEIIQEKMKAMETAQNNIGAQENSQDDDEEDDGRDDQGQGDEQRDQQRDRDQG